MKRILTAIAVFCTLGIVGCSESPVGLNEKNDRVNDVNKKNVTVLSGSDENRPAPILPVKMKEDNIRAKSFDYDAITK